MRCVPDRFRELIERQQFLRGLDQLHGLRDRLAVATDLVGLAAHARPVTGRPRLLAANEELDIFALRALRRATWLAVNPGGFDRANDAAVPAPVAAHERRPGGVGIEARDVAHLIGC